MYAVPDGVIDGAGLLSDGVVRIWKKTWVGRAASRTNWFLAESEWLVRDYFRCLALVLRRQGVIRVVLLVFQVQLECFATTPTLKTSKDLKYSTKGLYLGLRGESMYCTDTNNENERVGLNFVTAARTSEEGLKDVHLQPVGKELIREDIREIVSLTRPYQ